MTTQELSQSLRDISLVRASFDMSPHEDHTVAAFARLLADRHIERYAWQERERFERQLESQIAAARRAAIAEPCPAGWSEVEV